MVYRRRNGSNAFLVPGNLRLHLYSEKRLGTMTLGVLCLFSLRYFHMKLAQFTLQRKVLAQCQHNANAIKELKDHTEFFDSWISSSQKAFSKIFWKTKIQKKDTKHEICFAFTCFWWKQNTVQNLEHWFPPTLSEIKDKILPLQSQLSNFQGLPVCKY